MKEFYLVKWSEKRTICVEAEECPMRFQEAGWEAVNAEAFYDLEAIWGYEALQRKAEQFAKRYGRTYHTPCDYQTSDEENAFSYRQYIDGVADDLVRQIARLQEAIEEMKEEMEILEEQLDEACDLVRRADDCLEAIEASQTATSEN